MNKYFQPNKIVFEENGMRTNPQTNIVAQRKRIIRKYSEELKSLDNVKNYCNRCLISICKIACVEVCYRSIRMQIVRIRTMSAIHLLFSDF
jgi:hypothetical protein